MKLNFSYHNESHVTLDDGNVMEFGIFDGVGNFFKSLLDKIKDPLKKITKILPHPCVDLCIPIFERIKKDRGKLSEISGDALKDAIKVSNCFKMFIKL